MKLYNDVLEINVNLEQGCDVDSLVVAQASAGNLLTERGLQLWLKKGELRDPNTGGLSNFFGESRNCSYEIKAGDDQRIEAEMTYLGICVRKTVALQREELLIETEVRNTLDTASDIMQLEYFNCFLPPAFSERPRFVTAFTKAESLIRTMPLESWGQIRVLAEYEADGTIVLGHLDWPFWLELTCSGNTEAMTAMINRNLLTRGFNSETFVLQPGDRFHHAFRLRVCRGNVLDAYPALAPDVDQQKGKATGKTCLTPFFDGDPVFEQRWSHLCFQYDRTEPDDVRKVISELLAPTGYNGVIFELNRGLKTACHPELAEPWSLTIDEAKGLVACAREVGLKIGVQFNSPGHQNETGVDRHHPELLEPLPDTARGDTLCVSNPDARRLVEDILDEYQTAFQPDLINFGADEVQFEGYDTAFGYCSLCREKEKHALFADYMRWLFSLNRRPDQCLSTMWSDMLLKAQQFGTSVSGNGSAGDVWKSVESIPRDVQLLDWHYYFSADYRSLGFFVEQGFTPWAATAFDFKAIRQFLCCAQRRGIRNALHTTWTVPKQEELPIESMIWHAFYQWYGEQADEFRVQDLALEFCRRFW